MYSKSKIDSFVRTSPILKDVIRAKPVAWLNPELQSMRNIPEFSIDKEDMKEAEQLWKRFAPFFVKAFPELNESHGILESPLREIPNMQSLLNKNNGEIEGRLFLKCDNELPVTGSIKARGGFFEIMKYAEKLALESGMLEKEDDYSILTSTRFQKFFSKYKIGVGSTGNLGLSIGIISSKLGFQVTVYVSDDAKKWKKDLLREKGVTVIEFEGDFSKAIFAGREKTKTDPNAYFVDDEDSQDLFLGYTVGALRIAQQLKAQNIKVAEDHPLFVYSPCGVGGSPGGTAFGLKQIYGDNVHCFFVEPTHCPAVLTGLVTGEMSHISVQDIGLDSKTEADGLAVGRPSHFATKISKQLISGIFTIEDGYLFRLLAQLKDTENIFVEPSATAGLIGPQLMKRTGYATTHHLNMKNATHVAWATGGLLVPQQERQLFYERGCEQVS
ncbi:D-serine ammonia-lyase [Salegentibacter echinorum]|uniref:Probable D-serine dehydratase n=1 Tax=Salegentibacter echinorum TaxID=1073325 RepID=A0A1M5K1S9_SALEC|nr:D-serine ammonia-lyase [Salegentibacter echinorum]SHG46727.1 D-serine ammonia-lyase [Salegentibacter echinorum]